MGGRSRGPTKEPNIRLFVFTPTFGPGPRPETVASVAAQIVSGEIRHEVSWHNPFPTGPRDYRNILAQYQRGREMALDGGYDGLVTVEHDMRLPETAIQRLWDTPAPVVYATYLLRHEQVLNQRLWTDSPRLGRSLSSYPAELRRLRKAGFARVGGIGFGCTLIRREVLLALPFRDDYRCACDIPFAVDCIRSGYLAMGRLDTICDHYHEGVWLTPFVARQGGSRASA